MKMRVEISIPYLWGNQVFVRDEWQPITYLVGPNGTGKTRFAEELRKRLAGSGMRVRYLSAERMSGLERMAYAYFTHESPISRGLNTRELAHYKNYGAEYGLIADSWIILKDRIDVRLRVESLLSQMYGRTIRLSEEGGFLMPRLRRHGGDEYELGPAECHGLKELIGLLTFIHGEDYNCLILDEPELHLHPQSQQFITSEMRRLAGDPREQSGKKCFVIATHSPYMVDVRTLDDLRGLIVFQPGCLPRGVDDIDQDDANRIQRMLPRLNAHHKQFFFATRPIFVEGYTDQQFVSLLQELRGRNLGAAGVSVVDVGGKDEIDCFYRLCNRLNIQAHVLVDYDVLFEGKLRQTVDKDEAARKHLQRLGLGINVTKVLGEITQLLDALANEAVAAGTQDPGDAETRQFLDSLCQAAVDPQKRRRVMCLALRRGKVNVEALLPAQADHIRLVRGRLTGVLQAFRHARVHVLDSGELEHYLPSYNGSPYHVTDDAGARCLEQEREFLFSGPSPADIEQRYATLVRILDDACGEASLDPIPHTEGVIQDWIYAVQSACVRGEATDLNSLLNAPRVRWSEYRRILSVESFELSKKADGPGDECRFSCKARLLPAATGEEYEFEFTHETVPTQFRIPRSPAGSSGQEA